MCRGIALGHTAWFGDDGFVVVKCPGPGLFGAIGFRFALLQTLHIDIKRQIFGIALDGDDDIMRRHQRAEHHIGVELALEPRLFLFEGFDDGDLVADFDVGEDGHLLTEIGEAFGGRARGHEESVIRHIDARAVAF